MSPADNIWQVALALSLIVGVVLVLGFVAKRFQLNKTGGSGQLNIVDSAYLGPKERLVLVRVAEQHVLLAMNPQCITKLMEYESTVEDVTTANNQGFASVLEQAKTLGQNRKSRA